MDAQTILTAGITAAVVTGLFSLWRASQDARWRRDEARKDQLRRAVVDLLAADQRRYSGHLLSNEYWVDMKKAQFMKSQGLRPPDPVSVVDWEEESISYRQGFHDGETALNRIRLYSAELYRLGWELRETEATQPGDGRDPQVDWYDMARERFVTAAALELGIAEPGLRQRLRRAWAVARGWS